MRKTVRFLFVAFAAGCAVPGEAKDLKDEFPFGVFWAWERCAFNAEKAGVTVPGYAEKTLKLLRDMHCDAAWFVHGPGAGDLPWFMPMAEKYGVKAMINCELINYYYHGLVARGLDVLEGCAARSASVLGGYPALLGYVLKDEPLVCNTQHTDYFYKAMRQADPRHETAVIATPHKYQTYIEDTSLPVVCTDIYHFGGEKSLWIPQPAAVSQKSFRDTVHNAVTAAGRRGKHAWIMPMVFSNTWGPHYWDETGRHWALPGAYFHWRMPTPAEAGWQVWEAVRGGAKGVLFYLLNDDEHPSLADVSAGGKKYKTMNALIESSKIVERYGRSALNERKVELDRGQALTYPGGDPTPQFLSVGKAFGALTPHKRRLLACRRAGFPTFCPADGVCRAETFETDGSATRLGVVLNDDLAAVRDCVVRVPRNVVTVRDLNGGCLALKETNVSEFREFVLRLDPGSGALLEAEFADGHAGFPILREDFSRHYTKGSVDVSVAEMSRYVTFNIGADWQLTPKKGADLSKPAFVLDHLTNVRSANNTVFMNVNAIHTNGTVYLDVRGDVTELEVTAIREGSAGGLKTDTYHLGQTAGKSKATMGTKTVIRRAGDVMPVVVPVGTTSLEFRLTSEKASLREVVLWFVPEDRVVRQPDARHALLTRLHQGIPSVTASPRNGRLWCAWYGSPTGGEDSNNYVVLATSTDGGETWREVLLVDPDGEGPVRAFDPQVWVSPDGMLRLFWAERLSPLATESKDPYAGGKADPHADKLKMLVISAEKEPEAWRVGRPRTIARGVMMGKPVVLKDGTWALPVANWDEEESSAFVVSTDGGKTFSRRGGTGFPKEARSFDEQCIFERKDGGVEMWARARPGFIWRAESMDGGRTWTRYRTSDVAHTSSRFFLGRLKSGALLLVKHGAIDQDVGRKDLTAFVSDDDGKTWLGGLVIDHREAASYPDAVVLPDGRIGLVYDHNRTTDREVLFATLTEKAIRAGGDWLERSVKVVSGR